MSALDIQILQYLAVIYSQILNVLPMNDDHVQIYCFMIWDIIVSCSNLNILFHEPDFEQVKRLPLFDH